MKLVTHPLLAVVLTAALAACGSASKPSEPQAASSASPSAAHRIPIVVEGCNVPVYLKQYVRVGDGGRSVTIDGAPEGTQGGASIYDTLCVLRNLHVTDAIVGRMQGTRALDGTQQATWPGYSVTWTYHPEQGLDVVIEEQT